MRNIQSRLTKYVFTLFLSTVIALVSGCGGREVKPVATSTTTAVVSTAALVGLSTSGTKVKSDGSDSVTITATVLDGNFAALPNQALTLTSTSGQVSTSLVTTDVTGKATFTFSGGTAGTNDTATITAAANGSGASKSVPIQITGSTLALTTTIGSVATGTPLPITITAKDAGAMGVPAQTLRYSIAPSSLGSGTLSAATGTTDATGAATVSLTGTAAGAVDVLVEWLNAANVVTASATKTILVTVIGGAFSIATPASSPFAVSINTNQPVSVNVPAFIGAAASAATNVAFIRYSTTLGTWVGGTSVLQVPRTVALDNQTFNPGASAGNANIQVDALNAAGTVLSTATIIFSISSPSNLAASITLQSNVSVLQPSAGTNLSTATFTAMVRDAALNPVGGANVLFELVNSTGTGESISPVIVTTNSSDPKIPLGQAMATYTAGTAPTTQGAGVKATVIGPTAAGVLVPLTTTAAITVGGQATSVSLGASTTIGIINSNTAYALPVTVIVSDSSGARVSGAVVSLSLWPVRYYKGFRDNTCNAVQSQPFANEDVNSSLTLDPGEDIDGPGGLVWTSPTTFTFGYGVKDGALWPAPSTAGTIPSTVTTGVDGTATFDWVYLKQYANWIDARIRATLQVQGSQATTNIVLPLTPATTDIKTPCSMPNAPFN